jgi:LmbE family N-acetylglucosaminyl deacetylase
VLLCLAHGVLGEVEDRCRQHGVGVADERVTTVVDVAAYADAKRAALAAHRTQMGPASFLMRLPPNLYRQMAGRETFQRVVGPTSRDGTESDLFAGL